MIKALQNATQKVKAMDGLEQLQKKLKKMGPIPQGLAIYEYAIDFFNAIVEFEDMGVFDSEFFEKSPKDAEMLSKHLTDCGRDKYGLVRAKEGEQVSGNNLYLGNTNGLTTRNAQYWKAQPEQDVQEIIQGQLRKFIESHREPIMQLISKVLQNNKKPDNFIVKAAVKRAAR